MMADSLAIGAAQRTITLSSLRNIEINIPEVEQQQSIVDILSAYDDLIENNQKQIKLLEETVQRLYKEWFIDLRFPGHGNGEIIDGLPLGWHEDTIDTKVNLLNGFAFKSKDLEETGLFKLVTIKNVQDGYFEGKNVKYLSKIPDKMPRHCHLDEGDLLLSLTGNVGRVCIVEGNDFLLNQRVAKISSETPAYTYCLFRSNELLVKINNIANGAAQQNVSPIRIGQIKHLFPNDKLIMDFERVSGPILKRVVLMKKNIILLEEARDRLLPKLMNGEIEV
jgi:type I restriction enzyme S subunit